MPNSVGELIDQDPYMAEMQDKKERVALRGVLDAALERSTFMPPNDFISWLSVRDAGTIGRCAFELGKSKSFQDLLGLIEMTWPPEPDPFTDVSAEDKVTASWSARPS